MRERLGWVGAAAVVLVAGLAVRAAVGGPVGQHAGTALYAALVYAGVLVLRPRTSPVVAAVTATGFCWAVELFQLTGVPAALSARSTLARLVLGMHFDPADLAWYPAGALLMAGLHVLAAMRSGHAGRSR